MGSSALVSVFLCISIAQAYPFYRDTVPNGRNIKHPCNINAEWKGIGHTNPGGGGNRNPFGEDFQTFGRQWNKELCEKDSDQDGRTNGEELGDPLCDWIAGQPQPAGNLSHPGVCEPVDSDHCKSLQSLTCKGGDITEDCPVLSEPHVRTWNLTFPETDVPAKETNYYCQVFKVPDDKAYQAIGFEPIIDCDDVLHHMLIFGCPEDLEETEPERCGMFMPGCPDLIFGWGLGQKGYCTYSESGINLGINGYKNIALQLHWNNPLQTPGYKDASGVRVYFTEQVRRYSEQIGLFGQERLRIPPLSSLTTATSTCPSSCTGEFDEPRYITSAAVHMHYLGTSGKITQMRNGELHRVIVDDSVFDYDSPVRHAFDPPLEFLPGDEIVSDCFFNSLDGNRRRETETRWGSDTRAEMCYMFLSYFPGNPQVPSYYCVSRGPNVKCQDGIGRKSTTKQACQPCEIYPELYEDNQYIRTTGMCMERKCTKDCAIYMKSLKSSSCVQTAIGALMDDPQRALFEPLVSSYLDCEGITSNNVISLINAVASFPASNQCSHTLHIGVISNASFLVGQFYVLMVTLLCHLYC